MTTIPTEAPEALAVDPRASQALSLRWAALHDAAAAVAMLAGLPAEKPDPAVRGFPARARDGAGRRFPLIEQGLADMAAFMQPGLAALLAVNARGQDASVPAHALWQEFHAARAAIMALVPGADSPRRSA